MILFEAKAGREERKILGPGEMWQSLFSIFLSPSDLFKVLTGADLSNVFSADLAHGLHLGSLCRLPFPYTHSCGHARISFHTSTGPCVHPAQVEEDRALKNETFTSPLTVQGAPLVYFSFFKHQTLCFMCTAKVKRCSVCFFACQMGFLTLNDPSK